MGRKIVVFGKDQNFGELLASRLVAAGHSVLWCFPRRIKAASQSVSGDLKSSLANQISVGRVAAAVGDEPVHVVHTSIEPLDDPSVFPNKVAIATFMRELAQLRVHHLTFCSTVEVVGTAGNYRLTEDSPAKEYAGEIATLLSAENEVYAGQWGIPTTILRFGRLYDDLVRCSMLSHDIVTDLTGDKKSKHNEASEEYYAFLHRDDACQAILAVLSRAEKPAHSTLIHVTESKVIDRRFFHERTQRYFGGDPSRLHRVINWVEQSVQSFLSEERCGRAYHNASFWFDTSRAHKLLSWWPQHDIEREFEGHLARLQHNPRQWFAENGLTWDARKLNRDAAKSLNVAP